MHGNFFLFNMHTALEKKALLNKNMYVYSKSVLPAYLLKIVYIFIEKRRIKLQQKKRRRKGILKTRTIISVLRRFKFLQ